MTRRLALSVGLALTIFLDALPGMAVLGSRGVRFALSLAALALALAAAPASSAAPVSSHSMLHTCCTPYELKERLFAESKAMGASFIRVDVEPEGIFEAFGERAPEPNWRGLDEIIELSRRHDLPVLAILEGTPTFISSCPERWPHAGWCAPSDPEEWGRLAGEVAAHARGTIHHWQIRNEADLVSRFDGPPEAYARMLGAAHRHIKARVPEATVVLGGLVRSPDEPWLERFFAAAGPDAARSFDVASVHVRGRLAFVVERVRAMRASFARYGFVGPFWVTELGYPADAAHQPEPALGSGEPGQAAYLTEAVLTLAETGVEQVFVTLRDDFPGFGSGGFASEGVVEIAGTPPYESRRKLAFHALGRLSGRWDELWALHMQRRRHEQLVEMHEHLERSAGVVARMADSSRRDARLAVRVHERAAGSKPPSGLRRCRKFALAARSARKRSHLLQACALRTTERAAARAVRLAERRATRHRREALSNSLLAADYARRVLSD